MASNRTIQVYHETLSVIFMDFSLVSFYRKTCSTFKA